MPHAHSPASVDEKLQEATEQHRGGNLAEARRLYELLLAQAPDHALVLFRKGLLDLQQGAKHEALSCMRRASDALPEDARFKFGLGQALQALDRWDDAASTYEAVLRLDPQFMEALVALAWCLQRAGHLNRAVAAYRLAFAGAPDDASHGINLGIALCHQRDFAGAETGLRATVERHAESPDAWFNLGIALRGTGRNLEAVEAYRRAVSLRPAYVDALVNLGNVLNDIGEFAHAEHVYAAALAAQPHSIPALNNAACLMRVLGRLDEAEEALLRALEIDAQHAAVYDNLGNVYKDAGALEQAIACFRKALAIDPELAATHSNLAYALSFQSPEAKPILEECRRWDRRFAAPVARPEHYSNVRNADRRLRIGYVSADFREHCQSLFMTPLLSQHDHSAFEIVCYASVKRPDELTRRAKGLADGWRDVSLLDDEEVSRRIREDGIDILVDLTMHMSGGRPLVFARKPAPVQIAWLAYPGTTGISAMDFRLSDARLDPRGGLSRGGEAAAYSERTILLRDTFWCYDPLSTGLEVNELPALTRGYVTFGCLNNPCKLSEHTLGLWSAVMRALPASRLVLLAPKGRQRERLTQRLERSGIAAERVDFTSFQPRADYLRAYHGIDIGLDTFPYNGHTTSLDSLWMGVPVVTRVGDTCFGRGGLSQLHHLGLSALAAETDSAFIDAAVELAKDLKRLRALRAGLRTRLERSPLMDAQRFARAIEDAYRIAWRSYCNGEMTPTP